MNRTQTAAIASKERAYSAKYSPKTRQAKDAAQAELIARRKAFEDLHRAELLAGDPDVRAAYYALK